MVLGPLVLSLLAIGPWVRVPGLRNSLDGRHGAGGRHDIGHQAPPNYQSSCRGGCLCVGGTDNSWEHTIKCDICRQAHTQSGMTLSNNRRARSLGKDMAEGLSMRSRFQRWGGRPERQSDRKALCGLRIVSRKANPLPPQPGTRNPREREARDSAGDHLGAL